jgi:hypothetical protein
MNTEVKISHTPGPWSFDERFNWISAPNGDTIAIDVLLTHPKGYIVTDDPQRQANARLIAAAPDLLRALEGMLEWARRVKQLNPGLEIANAMNAVNKAKGA